ncbi:hypothetical protein [Hyalangium rubrum]|uniref:Uncharacterized protein n=1 Tax=Hyalangium rubrum TaxID=3103134 RepID=A0ABU5GWP8_9BACT|nr:hypothetical protein [Hyalangium sp. s54d21]MDY7225119.1 hypothetical protein [Hyalangium sp. s54d21]
MSGGTQTGAGLSPKVKGALVALLTAFMLIQFFHTVALRESNWPFADNAFFNYVASWDQEVMRVVLHEDTGKKTEVYVWNAVPLDYWVAVDVMARIYLPEGDLHDRQERFAQLILKWTNGEPWPEFDEFYPAAQPSPGARFVGLDVTVDQLDYRKYRYGEPLPPEGTRLLYSYRESGTPSP